MATHLHIHPPSTRMLLVTQVSILLAVIMTGIVSGLLVRSQMHRYDIQTDPVPIADVKPWQELGR
ncbi:MAG: hypothetical protein AAGF98_13110 [Cyanobacteria bacterium P01_H01_bin.153]